MFDTIIVAVDSSEQSRYATEVAGELAVKLSASVILVHVVDLQKSLVPEVAVFDERLSGEQRRLGVDLLSTARAVLPAEVRCETEMVEGIPAEEIVSVARQRSAGLIVMGSHGRGRLAVFMMGSTALAVLREASCPVMLVRRRDQHQSSGVAHATAEQMSE